MSGPQGDGLLTTPLHGLHVALGARMVAFAGYDMPVQYPTGIIAEHKATREQAGLFDVSHMGQARLVAADGSHETVARALETLVPADILALEPGRQRYSQLLNETGGIIDDLMIARPVDAAEAVRCCWSSMPPARRAIMPTSRPGCRPASASSVSTIAR